MTKRLLGIMWLTAVFGTILLVCINGIATPEFMPLWVNLASAVVLGLVIGSFLGILTIALIISLVFAFLFATGKT